MAHPLYCGPLMGTFTKIIETQRHNPRPLVTLPNVANFLKTNFLFSPESNIKQDTQAIELNDDGKAKENEDAVHSAMQLPNFYFDKSTPPITNTHRQNTENHNNTPSVIINVPDHPRNESCEIKNITNLNQENNILNNITSSGNNTLPAMDMKVEQKLQIKSLIDDPITTPLPAPVPIEKPLPTVRKNDKTEKKPQIAFIAKRTQQDRDTLSAMKVQDIPNKFSDIVGPHPATSLWDQNVPFLQSFVKRIIEIEKEYLEKESKDQANNSDSSEVSSNSKDEELNTQAINDTSRIPSIVNTPTSPPMPQLTASTSTSAPSTNQIPQILDMKEG